MKKPIPKIMVTDLEVHYTVNKLDDNVSDVKSLIHIIIGLVQTNPIYFRYTPTFHNGILIFAIIGEVVDHSNFRDSFTNLVNKLGLNVELSWSDYHMPEDS